MAISKLAQEPVAAIAKGFPCTVCQAVAELPPEDSAGLVALLSDPQRRFSEIAALIAADTDTPEWVRNIHQSTYARHAQGRCAARTKLR